MANPSKAAPIDGTESAEELKKEKAPSQEGLIVDLCSPTFIWYLNSLEILYNFNLAFFRFAEVWASN